MFKCATLEREMIRAAHCDRSGRAANPIQIIHPAMTGRTFGRKLIGIEEKHPFLERHMAGSERPHPGRVRELNSFELNVVNRQIEGSLDLNECFQSRCDHG